MRFLNDTVEEWLRENDPEYSKNKHYQNNRRFRRIYDREIPCSPQKIDLINIRGGDCI